VLRKATGWRIIGVEGLLPELDFFEHLANRRFPVTWWIRRPDQIDYIAEPDLFHDLFGHVPLLMNPVFADYMQAYGRGGVKAHGIGPRRWQNLTRLYWYTVEFGLIRRPTACASTAPASSRRKGESIHCLESAAPNRIGFDLERIMRTRYRIDTFQKTYFVIDSFEQLFDATRPDFTPIYARAAQPSIPAGDVLDGDHVYHRGSGEGWASDGDVGTRPKADADAHRPAGTIAYGWGVRDGWLRIGAPNITLLPHDPIPSGSARAGRAVVVLRFRAGAQLRGGHRRQRPHGVQPAPDRVPADCTQLRVTLKHTGRIEAKVMGHNWVLAETRHHRDLGLAGGRMKLADGYLPRNDARVIAATPIIGGGQSAEVVLPTSRLRKGGDYTFFCSFPGHWNMMKGKLVFE
jgi:phenylalanine-4-hydroxylase